MVVKDKIMLKSILISSLSLLTVFSALPASAEVVTFEKEYTYQASEFDSKASSRVLALEQTKRLLLEELGTYLISETEVKNFQMTKDSITVLTAGIVQTKILEEKWDGKAYYLKAKISADPSEVAKALDNLRQDKKKSKELEDAKKRADELEKEVSKLREELTTKADSEKIKKYNDTVNKLSATDWAQKGYSLLGDGNNKEALEAFGKALELNPEYWEVYVSRAIILYFFEESKDYDKILADIDKSIQYHQPDTNYMYKTVAPLHSIKTRIYKEQGYLKKAMQELEVAVSLDPINAIDPYGDNELSEKDFDEIIIKYPNDYRSYMFRGLYYSTQAFINKETRDALYKQAVADYEVAIRISPNVPLIYYLLGRTYHDRAFWSHLNGKDKDPQKAVEAFSKAIKLNPAYVQAYTERAWTYGRLKDYKKEIEDYDKVIEIDPDYGDPYYARGQAYAALSLFKNAIKDYSKAIKSGSKDGLFEYKYIARADAYVRLGEYEKAINDYTEAIKLGEGWIDRYLERGRAYYRSALPTMIAGVLHEKTSSEKSSKLLAAIEDFSKGIELCPKCTAGYEERADAYGKLKKYNEALRDMDSAINLYLEDKVKPGWAYWKRASIYKELGNFKQAISDYSLAIDYGQGDYSVYFDRGEAYLAFGNDQAAIKDYSHVILLEPKREIAYFQRGWVYLKNGNYSAALADFDKYIELWPTYSEAYYYRGFVQIALSNYKEGINDYKVAARLGHENAKKRLKELNVEW